ncbi:MAG: carboxypeptidase-like regulatory domain-containing protein [Bryobacteraceae bacterium]
MRRIAFSIAAILALSLSAAAQQSNPQPAPGGRRDPGFFKGDKNKKGEDENTRSVIGVVRNDRDDAVEGAIVQLKDTKSLRVRSFITKSDGRYQFHGLSTNVDYELRAKHRNQESPDKTLSVFDSRKEAVINLKLEPAKADEKAANR